jgi:hypothetical protein
VLHASSKAVPWSLVVSLVPPQAQYARMLPGLVPTGVCKDTSSTPVNASRKGPCRASTTLVWWGDVQHELVGVAVVLGCVALLAQHLGCIQGGTFLSVTTSHMCWPVR